MIVLTCNAKFGFLRDPHRTEVFEEIEKWREIYRKETAMNNFGDKVSFIWSVADLLRGPYKPNQYRDVSCPLLFFDV